MIKRISVVILAALCTFSLLNAQEKIITKGGRTYLSQTLIIKIKSSTGSQPGRPENLVQSLSKILKTGVSSVRKTFQMSSRQLSNIYTVKYNGETDPLLLAAKMSASKDVLWAEPRYLSKLSIVPDDPSYSAQYSLKKIKAEQAWEITKGDSTVIIGIVDTGIDWDHPDLAANMWINRDEIPNNNIDDDNNGYIDDYRGWDFGGTNGTADNDPREDNPDHGTHVAGIASAVSNNGTGIASIGYHCKLMPVKVSMDSYRDPFGNPYVVFGYEGIAYAADNGAKIVNCSFGGVYSRLGQEVIDYALSKGTLVVAAAGNENNEDNEYPASYNGALSVASVNQNDIRSSFSSYGEAVDVSAAGENIYSTWQNDAYTYLSGTSMSTPLVAGLAGLVVSRFPSYLPVQVGEQIRVNADPIDNLNTSYKHKLGYGRINAQNAVSNQNSKSVRAYQTTFSDKTQGANGNGVFEPGEQIDVTVKFRNILNPTSALQITLEDGSTYASISNPDFSAGAVNTLDSLTHTFSITLSQNVPQDYNLHLNIIYTDAGYSDYQGFTVPVNPTYFTQLAGNVKLTVTSKGNLGFNDYPDNKQGEGFTYRNSNNLLFEGAFMAGVADTKVSDAARAQDYNVQEDDFKTVHPFTLSVPGQAADQQGYGVFNDDNAGSAKIGIETQVNTYSYALIPYNDFILLRFDIVNTSGAAINNLFAGLFLDWDLLDGSDDKADYDTQYNFGYVSHTGQDTLPVVGSALVSSDKYNYYAILNSGEDSGFGIYDGFSNSEKWQAMSQGISKKSAGPDDVSFVIAGGPYNVNAGDTLKVAFTIAAHDSLKGLRDAIQSSRTKYQNILTDIKQSDLKTIEYKLDQNYPNPFNPTTKISWSIAEPGQVRLTLYDILGNKIKELVNDIRPAGYYSTAFDAGNLASGVYIYRLETAKFHSARKMLLIR